MYQEKLFPLRIHTHTRIQMYAYIYIQVCQNMYVHIYIQIYRYMYVCIYMGVGCSGVVEWEVKGGMCDLGQEIEGLRKEGLVEGVTLV